MLNNFLFNRVTSIINEIYAIQLSFPPLIEDFKLIEFPLNIDSISSLRESDIQRIMERAKKEFNTTSFQRQIEYWFFEFYYPEKKKGECRMTKSKIKEFCSLFFGDYHLIDPKETNLFLTHTLVQDIICKKNKFDILYKAKHIFFKPLRDIVISLLDLPVLPKKFICSRNTIIYIRYLSKYNKEIKKACKNSVYKTIEKLKE